MQEQLPHNPSVTPLVPGLIPAGQPCSGTMAVAAIRQSGLAPGAIAKLASAVTTAARTAAPGMPKAVALARLQLEVPVLNALSQQIRRSGARSAQDLSSLMSRLGRVMRLLGRLEPSRRGQLPASPAFRELLAQLPAWRQLELIDFFRFAEEIGRTPDGIDDATRDAFHRRCQESVLCRNPDVRAYKVTATWNWAVLNVPGWPGTVLTSVSRQ
jgi:hypothetical protein